MKRGQIYYISGQNCLGEHDRKSSRPGVIVSSDSLLAISDKVQVVWLTTHPHNDLPTHVKIQATGRTSFALCEQITWINRERLYELYGECGQQEMADIDKALMFSLGLSPAEDKAPTKGHNRLLQDYLQLRAELEGTRAARDVYKTELFARLDKGAEK